MLSGIANYIFGGPDAVEDMEEVQQQPSQKSSELKMTAVDNEWMLVDKSGGSQESISSCGSDSSNPTLQRCTTCHHRHHVCNHLPPCRPRCGGRQHRGLEESWLVTPPACFTAGKAESSMVQTHPMEDLLIEHPSMSVYGPRGREASTGMESEQSSSSSEDHVQDSESRHLAHRPNTRGLVKHQPPRRPHAVAARAGVIAQVEAIRPAQKAQLRHSARLMSRNKIERANRVKAFNSRPRRQRRSDHTLRHSGRSNNRRC